MHSDPQHFDAALTPLVKGTSLIEASAGTGKTYAIAMLALRLITEQAVKIEEILLVTFTRAATAELAERIRARLVEARDLLSGSGENQGDATLQRWADTVADREVVLRRIREALIDIDRAPVFTIHGFCQRMMREQALESGQLFDLDLQPDVEKVRQSVSEDFWRLYVYRLPKRQCSAITAHYPTPAALYSSVAPVSERYSAIYPEVEPLERAAERFGQSLAALAAWWQHHGEELHQALDRLVAEGKMKKGFAEEFPLWWGELALYFRDGGSRFPRKFEILLPEKMAEQVNGNKVRGAKKQELVASLPLPGNELRAFCENLTAMLLSLRRSLADYILEETERRMIGENGVSYDDLILRLHRAVNREEGQPIREVLRTRFQAVVIDEFQDTDSLQWGIFSRVFNGRTHYCYLIGDPKQSIYRFRGADIHSYFLARKAARQLLTLGQNYRSHPGMVTAVNALFGRRARPFYYDEETLAFHPVAAARTEADGRLVADDKDLANMVLCSLGPAPEKSDGAWSAADASLAMRRYVVGEIVTLFQGSIRCRSEKEEKELQPGDIAILVRKNSQAEEYREALAEAGIPAVLSSRLSVYGTEECVRLHLLLKALASPGDIELLKQAMSLPWFGLNGHELHAIGADGRLLARYQLRFQGYANTWQSQGILVMMQHLLAGEQVIANLAGTPRAERSIANIFHLLEVLQQSESDLLYGPLQLLQWLRRNMEEAPKEEELRLESDEMAVNIVTMHGAKGLEYPVVFCPFLWYRQTRPEEGPFISCHEVEGSVLDLGSVDFERRQRQAVEEEMAEEMRLVYVAITRAKYRCYLMWGDTKGRRGSLADSFASGLGYLLFPQGRVSPEEQHHCLQSFAGEHALEYLVPEDINVPVRSGGRASFDGQELVLKRQRARSLTTERHMTSYSALAAGQSHEKEDFAPFPERAVGAGDVPAAALPAGAGFGNVVHDILEAVPFAQLRDPAARREDIDRICRGYAIEPDFAVLEEMLRTVVTTPLGPTGAEHLDAVTLADLEEWRCRKEMGFYFHLRRGHTAEVNNVLAGEEAVGLLEEKKLAGFLTGFIDLIFRHGPTFYIVDYKTNYLGEYGEDYAPENLTRAMRSHNYGLQFWIYSLVVHRYLKNVLPGYDYESHFGGVMYLFVRGMDGTDRGVYFHRPDVDGLERLQCCFGAE